VSECKKLAQREYKRRHDNVVKMVHWKLCKRLNFKRSDNCGMNMYVPQSAVEKKLINIKGIPA